MTLKRRMERMEQKLRPGELRAAMECFIDQSEVPTALPADYPGLRQGVDEEGEAVISRWWSVWFLKEHEISKKLDLRN